MKLSNKTTMSLAAAMGCLAMSANAATVSIDINNHDFEVSGTLTEVPSWDYDGNSGINTASPLPDGKAVWINGTGVVSQTTGTPIVEGTTYTLTVDLGQQDSWAAGGGVIRLYGSVSGTLAEFDTGSLPAGDDTLLNQTTSFVATAGQATGQFIGVALIGGGGTQVSMDNVRLTAEAIPEPSSAALLGLGGLALILRRRK